MSESRHTLSKGLFSFLIHSIPGKITLGIAAIILLFFILIAGVIAGQAVQKTAHGASGGGASLVAVANAEYEEGVADGTNHLGGQKYWSYMGFSGAVNWCACFVSYCANQIGAIDAGYMPKHAAVQGWIDFYRANPDKGDLIDPGSGYKPVPGDIIIWKNSSISHIGIVEYYDADTDKVGTIEGNSSDKTMKNIYRSTSATYYVHPAYPLAVGGEISVPDYVEGFGQYTDANDVKTCTPRYGSRGWRYSQKTVHDMWVSAGSVYDSGGMGVATLNGKYLIACTSIFGTVGDQIDFVLSDGQVLSCIMADEKSSSDPNCTTYGHVDGGALSVLEFETNATVNPGSSSWCHPEWGKKRVVAATNNGSVL